MFKRIIKIISFVILLIFYIGLSILTVYYLHNVSFEDKSFLDLDFSLIVPTFIVSYIFAKKVMKWAKSNHKQKYVYIISSIPFLMLICDIILKNATYINLLESLTFKLILGILGFSPFSVLLWKITKIVGSIIISIIETANENTQSSTYDSNYDSYYDIGDGDSLVYTILGTNNSYTLADEDKLYDDFGRDTGLRISNGRVYDENWNVVGMTDNHNNIKFY